MNTNKLPLVSILIPFYNHNHFIKQTLDSIKEDTYENKEIIIINDGSSNPDDSNILKWVNEHPEVKVQYIKRENKGLTKTLNELIDLARGEYILVCASDDYLINNTINSRIAILKNKPEKMILISDNIVVDNESQVISNSNLFEFRRKGKKTNYFTDNGLKKELIGRWALAGPCFLAKKEIYTTIGKYDESLIIEDWDFFLRAAAKNLILFYDAKVSAYRIHENNTIKNPDISLRMYENHIFVAKKNLKLFTFPFNLYLMRRYIKHLIKIKKLTKRRSRNDIK
jgi:glycosyltransferase involved in cell wall biosynthesis